LKLLATITLIMNNKWKFCCICELDWKPLLLTIRIACNLNNFMYELGLRTCTGQAKWSDDEHIWDLSGNV